MQGSCSDGTNLGVLGRVWNVEATRTVSSAVGWAQINSYSGLALDGFFLKEDKSNNQDNCPPGLLMVGYQGASGNYINPLQFICGRASPSVIGESLQPQATISESCCMEALVC